jgi:hypothetical protein
MVMLRKDVQVDLDMPTIHETIGSVSWLYEYLGMRSNRIRGQTPWFYSKTIMMCILFSSEGMKLKVALIDSFEHFMTIFDIFKAFGRKISIIL